MQAVASSSKNSPIDQGDGIDWLNKVNLLCPYIGEVAKYAVALNQRPPNKSQEETTINFLVCDQMLFYNRSQIFTATECRT
jgi:hypothetical protein